MWVEKHLKNTSEQDDLTTAIDFIPAGRNFTVMLVSDNAPSNGFDVDVRGAVSSGGTYATLQADLIDSTAVAVSEGLYIVNQENSNAKSQMPYYKLFVDGDTGAMGVGDTLSFYIILEPAA